MIIEDFSPFQFARKGSHAFIDLRRQLDHLIAGRLWLKIIIALCLGVILGLFLSPTWQFVSVEKSQSLSDWLAIPGQLFISLIQLVVIPLVFASVILGIVSSDSVEQLRKLGLRIGLYYVFTTLVAVTIGFTMAFLLQPGKGFQFKDVTLNSNSTFDIAQSDNIAFPKIESLISGLVPNNPFHVLVTGQMLQVVILALFIGIALMALKEQEAKPIVDLLQAFQKISMVVIGWAMKLAPFAVFGLTAKLLAQMGMEALKSIGFYALTVIAGLLLIQLFYLTLVAFIGRMNPREFLNKIREVQLLAFSTSSSASVMPLTMETAQKKLAVNPAIAQLTVPLGTTINMDG
ncbi:MAG: dicarboxylate/amino acid:cation symporter, partial [Bdellovibrionales bacterium]|nr:dicarboxylate/amino acid:cation symporter [Bdellovibrionales bacterium]